MAITPTTRPPVDPFYGDVELARIALSCPDLTRDEFHILLRLACDRGVTDADFADDLICSPSQAFRRRVSATTRARVWLRQNGFGGLE